MASMQLAQVYFRPSQKSALQALAKEHQTNFGEEVRRAVDTYLEGMTSEELALLDVATQRAAGILEEITRTLADTQKNIQQAFAERDRIRAGII